MSQYIPDAFCFYNDSTTVLLSDCENLVGVQEEHFSKKKYGSDFLVKAIRYCLHSQIVDSSDIDNIVYYEKPLLKLEPLLKIYLEVVPRGAILFIEIMQAWLRGKIFFISQFKKRFNSLQKGISLEIENNIPSFLFSEYHQFHAESSSYLSPFEKVVVLCIYGLGEWGKPSIWIGQKNKLNPIDEINFHIY